MKQKLSFSEVKTTEEALLAALVRNECALFMTGNTKALTIKHQLKFMKERPAHLKLFLFRFGGIPCGYGVMRVYKTKTWLTGGLAGYFRGRGLGRELFKHLICLSQLLALRPWLSVKRSNRRAFSLYRHLGFVVVKITARTFIMRHDPSA